jgi:hypothetical protein
VTFSIVDATSYPGIATNDGSEVCGGGCSKDMSFYPDRDNQSPANGPIVPLYVFDFGGSITVRVNATCVDLINISHPVERTVALPFDGDGDLLPDSWETGPGGNGFDPQNSHTFDPNKLDSDMDLDQSYDNLHHGDGLTAFREFRGIILDDGTHERLNPKTKDLFVRGGGYNNSTNPVLGALSFNIDMLLGEGSFTNAFKEAGITVHDVTGLPSFSQAQEPPHIDILVVNNDTVNTTTIIGYANGFTNHLGSRYWTWDTKGASYYGNDTTYSYNSITNSVGGTYTYHLNLMHYFYNRPYWNETTTPLNPGYASLLDPLDSVEDYRTENGIGPEVSKGKSEDRHRINGVLDGDLKKTDWQTTSYGTGTYRAGYNFSTFDANGNERVELPVVSNALSIGEEYTRDEVQRHTIIHEMGHGVGIKNPEHTDDPTCVMYSNSNNWDRAGHFSADARAQIIIHNKSE